MLTQRGSPIFRGRTPRTDATSVERMKAAGAILLAKTNLPEFSYSTESDNLLTGRTNNPWNLERTAGGSSGGESAAIAAGMSPIGLAISVRGSRPTARVSAAGRGAPRVGERTAMLRQGATEGFGFIVEPWSDFAAAS